MRQWSDVFLIVVFIGGIAVFGAASLLRPADRDSLAKENRTPAARPPLHGVDDLKKLPGRFEEYFNDRLALREPMLNLHARIKVEALGVSSSGKVILGTDGWLFLDESSENAGAKIVPADQFLTWVDSFVKRQRWLKQRGIEYVLARTPEKHEIYSRYLPAWASEPGQFTPARHFSCFSPLEENLDLHGALWSERDRRPLYYRTDTHWNDEGAYVAYRALAARLAEHFPQIRPIDRDQFDEVAMRDFVGDLGRMLHLPDPPSEDSVALRLRGPKARRLDMPVPLDPRLHSPTYLPPQAWGTGDPSLPRGVLFHDSFAERLWLPLLAEHFDVLVYAPSASLDPNLVERFKPDVVIQQIVERKINRHAPLLPPGFGK